MTPTEASLSQMTAERLRDAREFQFDALPGSLNDHLRAAARTQRDRAGATGQSTAH